MSPRPRGDEEPAAAGRCLRSGSRARGGGGAGRPLAAATCRGAAPGAGRAAPAQRPPGRVRRRSGGRGAPVLPAGRAALPLPSGRRGARGRRRAPCRPPPPPAPALGRRARRGQRRRPLCVFRRREAAAARGGCCGKLCRSGASSRCPGCVFPVPSFFSGPPSHGYPTLFRAGKPGSLYCPTFYALAGEKAVLSPLFHSQLWNSTHFTHTPVPHQRMQSTYKRCCNTAKPFCGVSNSLRNGNSAW